MSFELRDNKTGFLLHVEKLEQSAWDQVMLMTRHPAVKELISIMPDAHAGAGCVIGFTGKFKDAVIPNIVGVDIGCGVLAYQLGKIDISYEELDKYIRENIPMGFASRDPKKTLYVYDSPVVVQRAKEFLETNNLSGFPDRQMGTLGGGNHFIEIEESADGIKFLTIHTGSRNFGKQVAEFYQKMAKDICTEMGVIVPQNLEYLPMSFGGKEYMEHLKLAQHYAYLNRMIILFVILKFFGITYNEKEKIESVHNYIDQYGMIRKGAISAHHGERVVIPLSMGEGIILGVGKGNKDYNFSAPHGAGRLYGRKEMMRQLKEGKFTMDNYKSVMKGIFSTSISEGTFDESPFAYKSYLDIEKHLKETIEVKQIFRPVYNIKAGGD